MSESVEKKIERLLSKQIADGLSDAETKELNFLLMSSEEAREIYIKQCQLHAALLEEQDLLKNLSDKHVPDNVIPMFKGSEQAVEDTKTKRNLLLHPVLRNAVAACLVVGLSWYALKPGAEQNTINNTDDFSGKKTYASPQEEYDKVARSLPVAGSLNRPAAKTVANKDATVRFNRDIRPIMSDNCYHCHGPDSSTREADLRLDTEAGLLAKLKSGEQAIVPGSPDASEVYRRIISEEEDEVMPPVDSHKHLSHEDKELIRQWIKDGAVWEDHWSLTEISSPDVPKVLSEATVTNPIDSFILNRLEKEGLSTNPEADKHTLIRRVSLDLTGLPPTQEEINEYIEDKDPNAYEHMLDRYFRSEKYGEHRARYWLDAARYSDTHGFHLDNLRSIWPYRDWVINAFNDNMPFDQFTVEQIAGDMLPNPTINQRVATGFNRCNPTTSEGGAIDDEYFAIYAQDRVEATSTVWLGLTMGCASCHDHKFDPISAEDFYQFSAFFRNTTQKAMDGNALDTPPNLKVPPLEKHERYAEVINEMAGVNDEIDIEKNKDATHGSFNEWLNDSPKLYPVSENNLIFDLPLTQEKGRILSGMSNESDLSLNIDGNLKWIDGVMDVKVLGFSANTHFDVGDHLDFSMDETFTISFWIRPTAKQQNIDTLFERFDNENKRGWRVIMKGGHPEFFFYNANDHYSKMGMRVEMQLQKNKWYHVALVYKGTGNRNDSLAYINGEKKGLARIGRNSSLTKDIHTEQILRVGKENNGDFDKSLMLISKTDTERAVIGAFTGADEGEGLDLKGDFVYAVNMRGEGGFKIGDAEFTNDSLEKINLRANRETKKFGGKINYGDSAADNDLEKIMKSIRWNFKAGLKMALKDLVVGESYRLQLLFSDSSIHRGFDVIIEDKLVANNLSIGSLQSDIANLGDGIVLNYSFVAKDDTLNINLGGETGFKDKNPILNAFTLEKLSGNDALFEDYQLKNKNIESIEKAAGKMIFGMSHLRVYNRDLLFEEVKQLARWHKLLKTVKMNPEDLNGSQRHELFEYYLSQEHEFTKEKYGEIIALTTEYNRLISGSAITLVMDDKAGEEPYAHILIRGEYDQKGDKVLADVPEVLPDLPEGVRKDRLALANWLVDEKNPLPARVTVNRYWQELFGTGIVKTSEDFGSQGEPPTHLDLLDWLAAEFIESGWDVKHMYKLMLMSSAYRQSSKVSDELYKKDPDNRLLARGPRFRLDAEMIRDQALYLSELMVDTIGGPPVKPYQPDGVWKAVGYTGSNTVKFVPDTGDKLYRRSLYSFWKRTAPPPSMQIFDAPTRESCSVRRERTNTPLQALVLMNDPQFVEAARNMAETILKSDAEDKFYTILNTALGAEPSMSMVSVLKRTYENISKIYKDDVEAAKQLVSVGESEADESIDPVELASWTMLANQIMNLDEFITKN